MWLGCLFERSLPFLVGLPHFIASVNANAL
jgi:hypothetical protein